MTFSANRGPPGPPHETRAGREARGPQSSERQLRAYIRACARDPYKHVMRAYPWGHGALAALAGPRDWQADILREVGAQLRAGHGGRLMPVRIAVASGHGIGKSALMAFLCHWAWSTAPGTRVVVTANTGAQLRTKTWPEIGKWFGLLACRHWFKLAGTSIQCRDPAHRQTWRVDQVTWSAERSEAFAGLHNMGKRIVVLFDEASTIADRIWEVTEGALTDADTEIVWIAFGNPTRNTGRFRECWGRHRALWTRRQIDSRSVPGTNAGLFAQWAESYGEDSDFVRVRVRGEFPRAGSLQFIASDVVEEARSRTVPDQGSHWPNSGPGLVLGVDVARFGDDRTVIQPRRGLDARTLPARVFRGLDTMQVASRVMEAAVSLRAEAVFVDEGGLGAGVVDRLRQLRCPGLLGVNFAWKADRAGPFGEGGPRFANKRAEIWGALREWLKSGAIAGDDELKADLTGVEYGYNVRDEILLESKADMKARGLASPDTGDALALTFAGPVDDAPLPPPDLEAMAGLAGVMRAHLARAVPVHAEPRPNMMVDDWEPYQDDGWMPYPVDDGE